MDDQLMKRLGKTIGILAFAISFALPALAQTNDVVRSIEKALDSGNVSRLLSHSSDRIAVAVFGEAREYSHSQAEYVLKDFFKKYRVKSFSFDDHSETDNGMFVQGRLRSKGDDPALQVFVRLRLKKSKWELREIIIRR